MKQFESKTEMKSCFLTMKLDKQYAIFSKGGTRGHGKVRNEDSFPDSTIEQRCMYQKHSRLKKLNNNLSIANGPLELSTFLHI